MGSDGPPVPQGSRSTRGRSGARQRGPRVRLDNSITLFLSEWPAEGASPATVRDYRKCLDWFCGFATKRGATTLEDLTPSLVRAAALAKMDHSRARSASFKGGEAAAAQLVAATRKLARWLLAEGLSVADLSSVRAPRVPERIQPRLLSEEFDRLQSAILHRLISGNRRTPRLAVTRDLALLNLLAETGLRAQEVCGLELRHVDVQRGEILIARAKRRKERVLSIMGTEDDEDPLRVVRLLDEWLCAREGIRRAQDHTRVWTSLKGNALDEDELRSILARICIEAGLAANRPPHAFRRYVFTEHYRQRPGSLARLTARMGWSPKSHKMQDVYTRGAELDFAREPMPLLNDRPKSTVQSRAIRPIPINGVGSGWSRADAPAPPTVGTSDGVRRASANSRRSPRLSQ
jgi:site-specific recombinase XerC